MNNSPASAVAEEPEHLFGAGSAALYTLWAARPSPKFTVRESDSARHGEPLKTTRSYNSLRRFPRVLIEIKFPHLTTFFLGGFLSHLSRLSVG